MEGYHGQIAHQLSVALTALAAIAFRRAQAPSPAQCRSINTISGSQIAACLRDLRSARTESQRGALIRELLVITCKISGRRPQAGEWTFGFATVATSPLTSLTW